MTKKQRGLSSLALGALGVVFGDIGTSPLYAMQVLFGSTGHHFNPDQQTIFGIVSLVVWSLLIVVAVKYVLNIMRVDNEGEGGILALVTLLQKGHFSRRAKWLCMLVGVVGVSLFYGDSVITPAISVLSAVEGVKVVVPSFSALVVPVTLVIISGLFWVQRYGTALIGRLFGPVMLVWFVFLATGGLYQVWQHPQALQALSPWAALQFIGVHPLGAFLALTIVVLAITGAEALYADMGHFGRQPIARAWFFVVFPALTLSYMGQGAYLLQHGTSGGYGLVLIYPHAWQPVFLVVAAVATLIASQSVISGAFSLTRQAMQLNILPKMLVRFTSKRSAGQIYLPAVNFILFITVVTIVLTFRTADHLAAAYGIAVSGTLAADTVLFLVVLRRLRRKSWWHVGALAALFLPLDMLFVSANSTKILHGGTVPIIIGLGMFVIITTWIRGETIVSGERRRMEGTLQHYVDTIHSGRLHVKRLPGAAVFVGHHENLAPLALHASVEKLHELPQKAVIVTVLSSHAAHVEPAARAVCQDLGYNDGISHLVLTYGFHDPVNVPLTIKEAQGLSPELAFDTKTVSYLISSRKIVLSRRHNMAGWRKTLYNILARNAASMSDYYKLPPKQVEEIETPIVL